jgi:hypothetical protein
VRLAAISALVLASSALARPLAVGLDLPSLALPVLFFQETPPPVVVIPPVAPAPADQPDVVTLHDGRVYRGRILYQVQGGLLFSDPRFPQSFVIPLADIANVTHPGAPQSPLQPPNPLLAERLMLEAQLRDLQLRLDSLSVFPAVGTIVGGGVSIGIGIFLYSITYNSCAPGFDCSTTNTEAVVFGLLAAIPGAVAVVLGTLELISVTNRQKDVETQIAQVKQSLAQLGSPQAQAGVTPPHTPPGLITLRF